MKPRLAVLCVITLAATALLACGKKSSSPPTAPPPAAQCSVSPASLDFGSVVIGSTSDRQFTLTNSGSGTLSGTMTGCSGFQVVGNPSYSLAAGQSRTMFIRFAPTAATSYACSAPTGHSGCAVACQGVGILDPDSCVVSPTALDFGTVTVGQSLDRTLTVTNPGFGTLAGTLTESCPDFSIIGSADYSLTQGQSKAFTIRFTPSSAGPRSCTISGTECPPVVCTGSGATINPACQLSVSGFSFPQVAVGDRADATFELTNTGTTNLVGTVTESCPDYSIPGVASYNLAPGASQTFIVRFEPSQVGEQTCEVNVGPGCPPISCWGSGVVGCTFTPANIDFGYIKKGDIRCGSVTLKNNTSTLQQGLLFAVPEGPNGYAGNIQLDGQVISGTTGLAYALNAGQSRTFTACWTTQTVTTPCDSVIAQWRLISANPACPGAEAVIRGVITRGCDCSLSATALDFGSVVVGDVAFEQTVHVMNTSGIGGLRGQVRVLSGDFEATPEYVCPPPGSGGCVSCGHVGGAAQRPMPVRVTFRPQGLGAQTGKILIENLAGCLGPGGGAPCDTVTVTGVGVTARGRD